MYVIVMYLVFLIIGQAIAVGVGLLLDPVSKTAALSAFIPIYYAMYWVAWRLALLVADPDPDAQTGGSSGRPSAAAWLLAPAVLAAELAD